MNDLEKITNDNPLPLALREELRRAISLGKVAQLSGDEDCRVEATKLIEQVNAKVREWRKARAEVRPPVHGTRGIMDALMKRAGVEPL